MPKRHRAVLLALALAACADGGSAPAGVSLDGLPQLALEEDLRIGSVGDPTLGFSQIRAIEVADDGSMYVLEAQDRQVRVYDAAGGLVRRFGASGAGPGEFETPVALSLVGDTVAVTELGGNDRITLFDRNGTLGRTIALQSVMMPADDPSVSLLVRPLRMRPDGRFDGSVAVMSRVAPGGGLPDRPESVQAPRIIFDKDGVPSDTAGWFPIRLGRVEEIGGTAVSLAPMLPDSDLESQVGEDSLVVQRPAADDAGEGAFTVTRVRAGGDTVFHRRLSYTPVAMTDAYRDSLIDGRVESYRDRPPPVDLGAIREALETEAEWPDFHPPVRSVRVGLDGRVWLLREAVGGATRWTVLEADGTPQGDVVLPPTLNVHQSDGDVLWGVETDALGVQWLVRYRFAAPR